MSQEDSSNALLHFLARLLKFKGLIISTTLMAGVAAVLISLYVLKPYYQSFALVYPTNLTMHERTSLFGNASTSGEDGGYYGTKHDANRILTVANSQWLIQQMIAKYNLAEHYGLSENTPYLASKTTEKFMDQFQVYKTEEDAIRINYIDTDPELAANLINDMVQIIDATITAPIQRNKEAMVVEMEKQLDSNKNALSLITQKIQSLPDTTQSNILNSQFEQQLSRVEELQQLVDQYSIAASTNTPGLEVIERAYPAERKIKPIRWLVCTVSVIGTFILSCLIVLLYDGFQRLQNALGDYTSDNR